LRKSVFICILLILSALFLVSCYKQSVKINEVVLAGPGKIEKLEVVSTTPCGEVYEKSDLDAITVSFNQAIVALTTLPEEEVTGPIVFDPPISGKYRWMGTATLKFIPDRPLPYATTFKATVPAGIKALTGAVLKKDYIWTFNTIRPDLIASYPSESFYNRLLGLKKPVIYLLFNQPVNPEKAGTFIQLSGNKNEEVSITIASPSGEDKIPKEWEIANVLTIKPSEKLSPSTSYTLKLKKDLPGKEGSLGLLEEEVIKFNTEKIFSFQGIGDPNNVSPENNLSFNFTNPVDYAELIHNIEFNPPMKIPEYYNDYGQDVSLYLYLPLMAQTKYNVKISKNIKDIMGNTLPEDINFTFNTADYSPSCYIEGGVGTIESHSTRTYPVSFMNMEEVRLQMATVQKEDVISLFSGKAFNYDTKYNPREGFFKIDRLWKLKLKKNQSWWRSIDVDEALEGKNNGFIFLQIDALKPLNYDSQYQKAFLQITNLGITGKFSSENNLISVNTLDTVQPVPDAKIEMRNDKNKVIWTGKTGSDGTATSPGWKQLGIEEDGEVWIFAAKDDDIAFINTGWNWSIPLYTFHLDYYGDSNFKTHVFTEKGIYRGGETVHIKGTMREKIKGKLKISSLKKLDLTIYNSRGEVAFNKKVSLSDYGSFNCDFTLKEDSPTGSYNIQISGSKKEEHISAYHYFQVEDYQAAQFEVTIKSDKDFYVFGDTFQGSAKGWYLFGAPMGGEKINWYYYLKPTYYSPPGYEGFDFTRDYYDVEQEREEKYLGSGDGVLNEKGEFPLSVKLTDNANMGPYILSVEGTVQSANRQYVSGYKEFFLHPGEYYIGVKPFNRFLSSKESLKFQTLVLTPDGKPLRGQKIKLEILKRQWNSVRKEGMNGETRWVSEKFDEVVQKFDVTSKEELIDLEFQPEKAGLYIIRASGTDTKKNEVITETYFYASGSDYVSWARYDDNKVDLVTDKKEYKPGDLAKIMVKSPYEKARALVTIEREHIIKHFFIDIKSTADTIEIPIENDYLPNVFISVILFQGRISSNNYGDTGEDLGKPDFKIGYVNLPVIPDGKRLKVTLSTDREKYSPRDEVTVNLHLENAEGKGMEGEITLSVVDLGVLNLTAFTTPDYFDTFYGERSLQVTTSETRRHIVDQRNYGQKGGNPGGDGGGAGATVRKNFIATAYYNPSIITDKSGSATVKFKLPDNVTTFLLMATVQTKDSSFGCAEKKIISTMPLLLKSSIPRFVRLYDKFKAGVLVFNGTDKKGEVIVECQSEGINLLERGLKKVDIPPGQEEEVLFSFESDKVTEGLLTFSCTMDTYNDAIQEKLPVKKPVLTEVVATSGTSEDSTEEALMIPKTVDSNTGHLEINTASTAMVNLKGNLAYLIDYPYLCLEQKLSKIFPLITAEDLINAFDLSSLKGQELRDFVQENLEKVYDHQKPSGGFTLWQDGEFESPFLAAYTMHTFALAEDMGYDIDQKVIEGGKKYLKSVLRFSKDDKRWNYPYGENTQLTVKAYTLYTLYLWGEGEASYLHTFYEKRNKMSLFGQSMLLRAIHMYGKDKEDEDMMVKELMNHIKLSPASAYFEGDSDRNFCWIYDSSVRTTALILQTFLEIDASFTHAPQVVKWLIDSQKHGRWDSTQENVFAFEALRIYFNKYEKASPDFETKASIDGKEVMKNFFKGRDTKCYSKKVPMSDLPAGKSVPVNFDKAGQGRLYYTLRLVYAPTDPRPARDEGISVFKSISPVEGNPTEDFKAGTVYKVTLSIVTPVERHFVIVQDNLAGGFELVNESLATENKALIRKLEETRHKERTYWWGTFNHWEYYDDEVLIFADLLKPGEHIFTYFVRAVHYGTFDMPYTKAELMYEPEVFGYSTMKKINVLEK